jgi:tRNA G18 (ribose-2'-O)-methylase SpoU
VADGFGFTGVITGGKTPTADNKAVNSSAMGAETWVKQKKAEDLLSYLRQQADTVHITGMEIDAGATPLQKYAFPPAGILVVGNEEQGIDPEIRELCHGLVYIPIFGRKHSLNVATAFAITAHHIRHSVQ